MKKHLLLRKILSLVFMLTMMTTIFLFSSQPAEISSEVSVGFTEKLVSVFMPIPPFTEQDREASVLSLHNFIRKTAHFFLYAMLGLSVLSFVSCYWKPRISAPVSALICLVYSATDEFHQLFVEGRGGMLKDVFLDFSGSLTSIVLVLLCVWLLRRIRRKKPAAAE